MSNEQQIIELIENDKEEGTIEWLHSPLYLNDLEPIEIYFPEDELQMTRW